MTVSCTIVLPEDEFDEFFACLNKALKISLPKEKKENTKKLSLENFK